MILCQRTACEMATKGCWKDVQAHRSVIYLSQLFIYYGSSCHRDAVVVLCVLLSNCVESIYKTHTWIVVDLPAQTSGKIERKSY